MGYDPTGHWSWGSREKAALGVTAIVIGLALLLAPPTGGASLACGSVLLSASSAMAAGGVLTLTGTAIIGEAIGSSHNTSNKKPTSRNQMQKQVENGQAPNEVNRVDPPHVDAPNQQNHIHFNDNTAINMDGSISHESRGTPNITKKILRWIVDNGWSAPTFLEK